MPRLCHPGAAYGCGHHVEHQEAARKGWLTRRRHNYDLRAADLLTDIWGDRESGLRVSHLHEHPSHRGVYRFKLGKQWEEMPRGELRALVREAERNRREMERATARDAAHEARYRERYNVQAKRMADATRARDYARVNKRLRRLGVRPEISRATGRERNAGEYRLLPKSIRRRTGQIGMDNIQEVLYEEGVISKVRLENWVYNDTYDWFNEEEQFRRRRAKRISEERYAQADRKAERAARASGKASASGKGGKEGPGRAA